MLNGVTWQPLLECQHAPQVASPSATVYREVEEPQGVLNPIQVSLSRMSAMSAIWSFINDVWLFLALWSGER